jgi:ABC-type nitrate/sulfonate/bicarbonate transport system substrate-binding protein
MKLSRRAFVASAAALAVAKPAIVRAAEPLTFGCVPANAIHWVACVLADKGLLKNEGFDAQIATIQNSPQSIQQLITGGYQIATSQPETFVAAVEKGGTTLAALSSPANRADWVLAGAAGVKTLQDLKGKNIGVSSLKVAEVWLTMQLLEKAGLKKGDYNFISSGLSPAKVTALQRGSIGAAVLFRPSGDLAIKNGATDLAHYAQMREYPVVLYCVQKEWAGKSDAGKRVARAIQAGHRWLWDPNNKKEALAILAKYTKQDLALLENVYRDYFVTDKVYSKTAEISLAGMKNLLNDLVTAGEVKGTAPAPEKFILDKNLGGLMS